MKSNEPQQVGEVVEALPSLQYKVRIGEKTIRCYVAGKMVMNKIRVMPGDRVSVVVSGEIGRITRRL